MAVTVHTTPNPAAMKFVVGVVFPSGRSYRSREQAAGDPIAARLFDIPGVESVFMTSNFVTVSASAGAEWPSITPGVLAVLETL